MPPRPFTWLNAVAKNAGKEHAAPPLLELSAHDAASHRHAKGQRKLCQYLRHEQNEKEDQQDPAQRAA
jgi:hypothetical protein